MIVHRVGHIANQRNIDTQLGQLSDAEGASQHAHVQVYAQNGDVFDLVLSQQVIEFLPVVGDCIGILNLQRRDLPCPRVANGAFCFAVAAHVGVVNRQLGFTRRVGPAPAGAPPG